MIRCWYCENIIAGKVSNYRGKSVHDFCLERIKNRKRYLSSTDIQKARVLALMEVQRPRLF